MSKSEPVSLRELAEWLVERGLANDRAGYGHATGEHVAEELLSAFTITRQIDVSVCDACGARNCECDPEAVAWRQNDGYAPCPECGAPSLASITDHICEDCADTYVYCPTHANSTANHVSGNQ